MSVQIAAVTDAGTVKEVNQDAYIVKSGHCEGHTVTFAAVCDGMGGLQFGEVASSSVIQAFHDWFQYKLPYNLMGEVRWNRIKKEISDCISQMNQRLKIYSPEDLGTTLTAILIIDAHYLAVNVGDSRLYELQNGILQISKDQTFVAREVSRGNMTPEEAAHDPRKNVLLQCIGASPEVVPDFYEGDAAVNTKFLLCSDGFRHEITSEEIWKELQISDNDEQLDSALRYLVELVKIKGEQDNITAVALLVG